MSRGKWIYTLRDSTGEVVYVGSAAEVEQQGLCPAGYLDYKRRRGECMVWGLRMSWEQVQETAPPPPPPPPAPDGQRVEQRRRMIYTLYDTEGKLLGRGTARELVEQGLVGSKEVLPNMWRHGHGMRRWGIGKVERAEELVQVTTIRPAAKPKKKSGTLARIKDPGPLDWDVHDLTEYNRKAKRLGRKELDYGYWVLAGRPKKP